MPEKKYITLKEAADLSGYAPDYIGQLIRQGKISGKQVYYNVAWVTTETAVREYLEKGNSKGQASVFNQASFKFDLLKNKFSQKFKADKAFKIILYIVIFFSTLAFLFLFYIISVSISEKLEQKNLQRIEEQSLLEPTEPAVFNSL